MNADACTATMARIDAALDGDLDAAECRAIDAHCQTCAACATLVGGLRQTVGLCRDVGAAPLPEDVRRRAQSQVRRLLRGQSARE